MKTQDGSNLKVGDTITIFDDRVRKYDKPGGWPIYRASSLNEKS